MLKRLPLSFGVLLVIYADASLQASSRFPNTPIPAPPPYDMASADFNGDGFCDLITVSVGPSGIYYDRILQVLLNDGAGGVSETKAVRKAGVWDELATAELDGDTEPEVLVAWNSSIYLLDFDGTDTSIPGLPLYTFTRPLSGSGGSAEVTGIDAIDLDKDGITETLAITANYAEPIDGVYHRLSTIVVLQLSGESWKPFKEIKRFDLDSPVEIDQIIWVDSADEETPFLFGSKKTVLYSSQRDDGDAVEIQDVFETEPSIRYSRIHPGRIADFANPAAAQNRVISIVHGKIQYLEYTKNGCVVESELQMPITGGTVCDWNADGIGDLISYQTQYYSPDCFIILTGKPEGYFDNGLEPRENMPPLSRHNWPETGREVFGDINEDGLEDRIKSYYYSMGNGHESWWVEVAFGDAMGDLSEAYRLPSYLYETFALFDFDGDGHLDLLHAPAELTKVYFYRGKGDGTFFEPVESEVACAGIGSRPFLGDYNGDGLADLLFTNGGSDYGEYPKIYIGFGHGDGAFGNPESYTVVSESTIYEGFYFGSADDLIEIVDANGDALDDIWFGGDIMSVWINRGTDKSNVSAWQEYDLE